jgi:N-glycosidase YbiA
MQVNGIERDYIVHDDNYVKGFFGEYRWLSNYHHAPILWKGLGFTSTEAAYQSSKCSNVDAARVFQNYSASDSKKHAPKPPKNWNDVKFNIMAQIVFQKFLIHKELRESLLETGDRYLEETNHWGDQYWGVCDGVGENNLGRILMATREYLKVLNEKDITS